MKRTLTIASALIMSVAAVALTYGRTAPSAHAMRVARQVDSVRTTAVHLSQLRGVSRASHTPAALLKRATARGRGTHVMRAATTIRSRHLTRAGRYGTGVRASGVSRNVIYASTHLYRYANFASRDATSATAGYRRYSARAYYGTSFTYHAGSTGTGRRCPGR